MEHRVADVSGIVYQRVNGVLGSLADELHQFEEHRVTLLCAWSSHSDRRTVITVLEDLTLGDSDERDTAFLDWKYRGFSAGGKNAVHHLLQSAVHAALNIWSKEWSKTLDSLDELVSTEVYLPTKLQL